MRAACPSSPCRQQVFPGSPRRSPGKAGTPSSPFMPPHPPAGQPHRHSSAFALRCDTQKPSVDLVSGPLDGHMVGRGQAEDGCGQKPLSSLGFSTLRSPGGQSRWQEAWDESGLPYPHQLLWLFKCKSLLVCGGWFIGGLLSLPQVRYFTQKISLGRATQVLVCGSHTPACVRGLPLQAAPAEVECWARAGCRQGTMLHSAASLPAGGGHAWRGGLHVQPHIVSSQQHFQDASDAPVAKEQWWSGWMAVRRRGRGRQCQLGCGGWAESTPCLLPIGGLMPIHDGAAGSLFKFLAGARALFRQQ